MTASEAQKWLERFEWDDSEETSDALGTICEALQEYPKFKAIGTAEEFKAIKQWKEDIIESFSKYDVNSVDELMKRFRELTENNDRIIGILRTHRFTDEECIEKITEIVGIHSQN